MASSRAPVTSSSGRGAHLVLYDGVCGLCNRLNRFVLKRDSRGVFDFASLQSATGRDILQRFGKDARDLDTVYVLADYHSPNPRLVSRAAAVLFVLRTIGGPWRVLTLLGVLPKALLDAGYDLVARWRYKVFGQYRTCPLPSPADRKRFIDV
jgi:predicted DCC family thiol-disulfide oxidoreductase YuxK